MKIIKIILFALLALISIASTGIFIFFQTFDSDQYLSPVTKKASLALGRQVSIRHLGLGLSQRGITLDAGPVIVADDVDFTTQPFIKIVRVRISLDLKSLVFRREVHITGILLQSPQIHFIRSQEGNFNIQSLKRPSRGEVVSNVIASPKGEAISERTTNPVEIASSLKSISRNDTIKSITIQDAAISFIDQSPTMPLDIWLTNINASISNFLLSKQSLLIDDLGLNMDLSQLDIKYVSPEISDNFMFKNMAGVVRLNINHLEMDTSKDISANGDINIKGGVIRNFNIIKTVLSHTLGALGGMEGNIDNLFNGPLKDKLGEKDTVIDQGTARFSFHDKTLFIDDSLINTDIFEFKAQGSVDQGLNMDLQTMLHLNGDVTAALINEMDGLKYLSDDSQRIAIGAGLKGVIPHLKYKLNKDFRKKSKKMLMEEGGSILGALLGGGPASQSSQDVASQDFGEKPKKKFKNMMKMFLQ